MVLHNPTQTAPTKVVTTIEPWRGDDPGAVRQPFLAWQYLSDVLRNLAAESGVREIDVSMQGGGTSSTRSLSWRVEASGGDAQVDRLLPLLSTTLGDLGTQGARITSFRMRADRQGASSLVWTWKRDPDTGAVTATSELQSFE